MFNLSGPCELLSWTLVVVSVMFYPCILGVALLVYLFVLCVACLTVFVGICCALLDRPCMVFQRMCVLCL